MGAVSQLDVFITSTCYDLIDLRAELGRYLKEQGFLVRLSDDPQSTFAVEPTADSIESCLANVEAADVVLCIIDRRYGDVLKDGPYKGKSATQAEVEHARRLKPAKPIFFFIRDKAAADFSFIRDNDVRSRTRWVEETNEEQRRRWFEFVKTISQLPKHENWSNWYDPFKDVVDLKQLVYKRLVDRFPQKAASLALSPDRFVRITFVPGRGGEENVTVHGHFQNVGVGPALNLVHGVGWTSLDNPREPYLRGGLPDGQSILTHDGHDYSYSAAGNPSPVVFCEYENRFRDKYRVEQAFSKETDPNRLLQDGPEVLFVGMRQDSGDTEWIQV